jgi:hypothetical protein
MKNDVNPYRSLSSIARQLLPKARKMHKQGMTWTRISKELGISHTSLYTWRKLEEIE